jgi:Xaa-Pro dipeptidase
MTEGVVALRAIDRTLFGDNRARLAASLPKGTAALLQGAPELPKHDTDMEHLFRQESYFFYLFGYNEPDCYGVVVGGTGHSVLFVPRIDPAFAVWFGPIPTPEQIRARVLVDEVAFVGDMPQRLRELGVEELLVLVGNNTDSGRPARTASFAGIDAFRCDAATSPSRLVTLLSVQRSVKTAKEVAVMQYANDMSSRAHVEVMRKCRPGMSQNQLEAIFLHYVYYHGGCRFSAYTCICASGACGAYLHYPNNDKWVVDGQMALLDMGGEYECYASDITCSFPVNGKFTASQRFVYEAVLDSQRAVFAAMRPGVSWVDMHRLALTVMLRHLIRGGLVTCSDEAEAMRRDLMYTFMPHGLGHLFGLDVHDVGGYHAGAPARPTDLSSSRLRTARLLEPGMAITVEPGMYFNHVLLEKAFADPQLAPLLNERRIRDEFWHFGGVRIEDNVVVTATGIVNMTQCPRDVADVEAVMAGAEWKYEVKEFVNVQAAAAAPQA